MKVSERLRACIKTIGTDIYMLSSNLNLNIGKTAGYNNKILLSNIGMKICSNRSYHQLRVYHQKSTQQLPLNQLEAHAATGVYLMKSSDKSTEDAETILSIRNQHMGNKKQNDEKLAIALLLVGTELIAYHIW